MSNNSKRMKTAIHTVADSREDKARKSGDYEAHLKGLEEMRIAKAKREYLQSNPDVGVLIRNGKEVFYRNLEPYHLGRIQTFNPMSVLKF